MAWWTRLISNIDAKGSIDVLRPSNSLLSVISIVFAYILMSSIFLSLLIDWICFPHGSCFVYTVLLLINSLRFVYSARVSDPYSTYKKRTLMNTDPCCCSAFPVIRCMGGGQTENHFTHARVRFFWILELRERFQRLARWNWSNWYEAIWWAQDCPIWW